MGKQELPEITLRYDGLFDFDKLYSVVIDWAKTYGYMWHETAYKHKVPKPTGAEQELLWELTKNVTEYINFTIRFFLHLWDTKEIQVDVNGKKKSLTEARIDIKIIGQVNWDWQKKFAKGGRVSQLLGRFYEKATFKDISIYFDQLYYRTWNLHALLKKYFEMQTKKYSYKGYLGEH